MRKGTILLCYVLTNVAVTLTAKILVLSPLGPRSHINSFMPLVETLAEKGHNLTVVTAHAPKVEARNIRKIVLDELVDIVEEEWYDFKDHGIVSTTIDAFKALYSTWVAAYDKFMTNKEVQEIQRNKIYDIVIVDGICNDFVLPLVDHLGIPFIFFDPGTNILIFKWI